jgi:hypothetical protein
MSSSATLHFSPAALNLLGLAWEAAQCRNVKSVTPLASDRQSKSIVTRNALWFNLDLSGSLSEILDQH